MANPTPSSVYVDAVYSQLLQSYVQDAEGFIARDVFPWLPVDAQTGLYPIFDKNDMQRDEMQTRAPGSEAEHSGFRLSTSSFTCIPYALKKLIDDQTKANAKSRGGMVDLEMAALSWLGQKFLLRVERQWASDFFKANVWGGGTGNDVAVANQWSDQTNGDPLLDITNGKTTIIKLIGRKPNTLVIGWEVFAALTQHPEIKDQFKYTSSESITEAMLAGFFGIDNLRVASAIVATNVEKETAVRALIVGKAAWLGYVAKNPGWGEPSAGYTLYWEGVTDGLPGITGGVTQNYNYLTRSDEYELQAAWTNVLTAPDAGLYYPAVVA